MRTILASLLFAVLMTTSSLAQSGKPSLDQSNKSLQGQSVKPSLLITHLTGNFYIYTTYQVSDGSPYPANGLYLVTDDGVVLIDTPWDPATYQPLLDSIQVRHHKKVVLCLSTHFHDDRTGGLPYFQQKGIATWSSALTLELCREHHENQAAYTFSHDTTFRVGKYVFQTYYPGEGHTKDNIVIWFPADKVLYGGCLVKSMDAGTLGNLADANTQAWPLSIKRVIERYPKPAYIIPGHLGWTDTRVLEHTLDLLNKYQKSNDPSNPKNL